LEIYRNDELDSPYSIKKNVEILVQKIFINLTKKLLALRRYTWINNDAKLTMVKNIIKPDFTLCRRRQKHEEDHISYREYPLIAVFTKVVTKNKKADILSDLNKIYKTLREFSKFYRINKLVGVVTNF
jgi:hypothetical protein